jgi:hypothetical protein
MKKSCSIFVFLLVSILYAQKVPGGSSSTCIVGPDNLALNQTGVYSVSSALSQCTQCHDWDVNNLNVDTSSNAQITTDDRLNTVSIKRIGTGNITITVNYITEEGCKSCSTIVTCSGCGGSVSCDASILQIWCDKRNNTVEFPQFNVQINVRFLVTNPFPNNSGVLVSWDPDYLNGFDSAGTGGVSFVAVNSTNIVPFQFYTSISTPNATGFYIPLVVKYTDLVTGQVCVKKLNPLVTNNCLTGHPMRIGIFPNPSKSQINFEGENLNNYNISIYDMFGNEVKNEKIDKSIDIENFDKGIYLYKISEKGNIIQEGKVIKE